MTTCSICYEEFNNGENHETAGSNLDINISIKCETPNCECIICHGCEIILQQQIGKDKAIKCPFCRQLYLKNHFKWNVLQEDLLLWKEKQKRKLNLGIACKQEIINVYKKMIKTTHKQLEELNEQIEFLQNEMNEKIEKLAVYN
jgi:hypothetical protein